MEKTKINYKKILITIFIIASIFRIFFISFSKIDEFQYDVGVFNLQNSEDYEKVYQRDKEFFLSNRHLDYILTIYETGQLPKTNDSQLYHPPFYHIISAAWLKVIDIFPFSAEIKLESLQIITCIYSIITLWILWKILEELEIEDKLKTIAMAVVGFHPIFVYMAGLINNDTLLTMFSMLSILYILKWYKNANYKNAIILSIIIGLGTLTKSSMLVNLLVVAITFFIKFLEMLYNLEYKKVKEIVFQGIVFSLIALTLILCFPIRNYLLFGQGFFVVHDAADWLYVGNENPLERFGIFNKDILNNVLEFDDQNILSYVIKSAIVFETNREVVFGTTIVKYLSIILMIATLISMLKLLFTKEQKNYILISTYFLWIIFFVSFNIQMPNSCSMHARYIITAIVISIICLSKELSKHKKSKWINVFAFLTLVFCIFSSIVIVLNVI